MRCPSARALIKPHTLHHLLITSKQQQESSPGQHLWMRGQGTKRQADRKWQQVSPLLIQGPCGPMVHSRGSISFSSSSHKHATTEICTEKKGRGENARGPKHFTQSILVVSSFAGLVVTTLLHTHKLQTSANRASKLVTLFLIGIKIPSSFPSQQPLKGNADWLALWYPLSSDPHPLHISIHFLLGDSDVSSLWTQVLSPLLVSQACFLSPTQSENVSVQLVWEGLQGEFVLHPPPASLSHVPAELWLPHKPLHGLREGLSGGLAQEARLTVGHAFQRSPGVHRHHGAAAVHGLDRDYPEMLPAGGVQHSRAAPQQRHFQRIRRRAKESDTAVQAKLLC